MSPARKPKRHSNPSTIIQPSYKMMYLIAKSDYQSTQPSGNMFGCTANAQHIQQQNNLEVNSGASVTISNGNGDKEPCVSTLPPPLPPPPPPSRRPVNIMPNNDDNTFLQPSPQQSQPQMSINQTQNRAYSSTASSSLPRNQNSSYHPTAQNNQPQPLQRSSSPTLFDSHHHSHHSPSHSSAYSYNDDDENTSRTNTSDSGNQETYDFDDQENYDNNEMDVHDNNGHNTSQESFHSADADIRNRTVRNPAEQQIDGMSRVTPPQDQRMTDVTLPSPIASTSSSSASSSSSALSSTSSQHDESSLQSHNPDPTRGELTNISTRQSSLAPTNDSAFHDSDDASSTLSAASPSLSNLRAVTWLAQDGRVLTGPAGSAGGLRKQLLQNATAIHNSENDIIDSAEADGATQAFDDTYSANSIIPPESNVLRRVQPLNIPSSTLPKEITPTKTIKPRLAPLRHGSQTRLTAPVAQGMARAILADTVEKLFTAKKRQSENPASTPSNRPPNDQNIAIRRRTASLQSNRTPYRNPSPPRPTQPTLQNVAPAAVTVTLADAASNAQQDREVEEGNDIHLEVSPTTPPHNTQLQNDGIIRRHNKSTSPPFINLPRIDEGGKIKKKRHHPPSWLTNRQGVLKPLTPPRPQRPKSTPPNHPSTSVLPSPYSSSSSPSLVIDTPPSSSPHQSTSTGSRRSRPPALPQQRADIKQTRRNPKMQTKKLTSKHVPHHQQQQTKKSTSKHIHPHSLHPSKRVVALKRVSFGKQSNSTSRTDAAAKLLKDAKKMTKSARRSQTMTTTPKASLLHDHDEDMPNVRNVAKKRPATTPITIAILKRSLTGSPVVPPIAPSTQSSLIKARADVKARRIIKHANKRDKLVLPPTINDHPSMTSTHQVGVKRKKDSVKLADKVAKGKKIAAAVNTYRKNGASLMEVVEEEEEGEEEEESGGNNKRAITMYCSVCNEGKSRKYDLERHMLRFHPSKRAGK